MTIKLRPILLALPIILIVWIALLAGVMRASGQAPAALVILPPSGLLASLPDGVSITSIGRFSITLKGDVGLVAALYKAGAPLVLPAGLTGCLSPAS